MIQVVRKIALLLALAIVVVSTAADDATKSPAMPIEEQPIAESNQTTIFVCESICGDSEGEDLVLSNPDLEIEYNWNLRVPVCAGLSCESGTCSAFEEKLPGYDISEFDCKRHQTNLQEAGCQCGSSGGPGLFGAASMWIAAAATAVMALLL